MADVKVEQPTTTTTSHEDEKPSLNIPNDEKIPVFWCEICTLCLPTPTRAISHFRGKSHKAKVSQMESRKRAHSEPTAAAAVVEPAVKKIKSEPVDQSVRCEDCDITLNSPIVADAHFKGKKHLSNVAKKEAAKNSAPEGTTATATATSTATGHFCECCQIALNSDDQVKQHFAGQKHKIKSGEIVRPVPAPRGGGLGFRGTRGGGGLAAAARGRGWVKSTENSSAGDFSTRGGARGGGGPRGGGRGGNRGFHRGGGSAGAGGGGGYNNTGWNQQKNTETGKEQTNAAAAAGSDPYAYTDPTTGQYNNYYSNGGAQNYNGQNGSIGYGGYYGQNKGSEQTPAVPPTTQSYYSDYTSFEQKTAQYQTADATYDSYYG